MRPRACALQLLSPCAATTEARVLQLLSPCAATTEARVLQLLKPVCLEPLLCNKRSHRIEKPEHCNEEYPLLAATRESPCTDMETQCSQKKNRGFLLELAAGG